MKQKTIPDELLALMAQKFRMLSDPTRLAILRCMMQENELRNECGLRLVSVE